MTESSTPATDAGTTKPAGEGVSDQEMTREVADSTSSDLAAEDVFERDADGTDSDKPVADEAADEV